MQTNMRPKNFGNGILLAVVTAVLLATTADVPAAVLSSSVTIPVAGIVDGQPESVALSGKVTVVSRLSFDTIFGEAARNRITIRLVNVSGVGLTSGARYVATGENTEMRFAVSSDQFETTFPLYPATTAGTMSARSAAVSITLNVNVATGAIGGTKASISTPKLPG